MVFSKIWLEVRSRFYISLVLAILTALFLIVTFPFTSAVVSYAKPGMSSEEWAEVEKRASDYRLFMDEGWFNELGFIGIFAVVLTLGGVMTEKRRRSILFTLSLPVSRKRWVLSQGLVSVLLLTIIAGACSLLILAGGWGMGKTFPLSRALAGTLLKVAGALPLVGMTLLFTSITQDRLKAALLVFCLAVALSPLDHYIFWSKWMPESILILLEPAPFPWQAVITILVVPALSILSAIKIFENRDF